MSVVNWTRNPVVAGRFYPSEKLELEGQVKKFIGERHKKRTAKALIVPHAGYIYSGAIAGQGYREIEIPRTVICLAPNHTGLGKPISVWSQGAWLSPLGEVGIDEEVASLILKILPTGTRDREAHLREHAIEVHLPFLQILNPNTAIVPIVLGPLNFNQCHVVGEALKKAVESRPEGEILIIASTDMSHYIPAGEAKVKDSLALEQIKNLNASGLFDAVVENEISMCGFIPTTCALVAAVGLGAKQSEIVAYGNSGDRTKDYSSVVGYASGWVV